MMVHFNVNAKVGTHKVERNVLTSMNARLALTTVIQSHFVRTLKVHFNVNVTMAIQEMACNVLTSMNATLEVTTAIHAQSV